MTMQPDPHAATLAEPSTKPQSPTKAAASLVGRVLKGSYRVDSVLGQGAMGTVCRGTQLGIDKTVAIKVIRADGFSSDAAHDRFQREATLVSKLLHPGIAQVLDFGFEDDMPFLVMEFVEGKELTQVLAEEGPMPPARALAIVRQLASALGEAHGRGVVHRDIKPQNLRLMRYTPGGQIFLKVLDFGIAKQLDEGDKQHLTATGAVIGTVQDFFAARRWALLRLPALPTGSNEKNVMKKTKWFRHVSQHRLVNHKSTHRNKYVNNY
jgi:serine/threonine protein kinase